MAIHPIKTWLNLQEVLYYIIIISESKKRQIKGVGMTKKIVHVDDDQAITNLVAEFLKESGLDYKLASFDRLGQMNRYIYDQEEEMDLIILDGTIQSPFDGRQQAERLYKHRSTTGEGPKVLLITGDPYYLNKPEGMAVIGKPFVFDEFIDQVKELLK